MLYLKIHPNDNVAVAISDLKAGTELDGVVLTEDIAAGHKFALCDIAEGADVVKYGYSIGRAIATIPRGGHVWEKNIKTRLEGKLDYTYEPVDKVQSSESKVQSPKSKAQSSKSKVQSPAPCFLGYERKDGTVGIRNEIWIIPTVGCVSGTVRTLAERFRQETNHDVVAFPHNYGCSQLGGDHENTRKILADMVHHPNVGGVLVVGLGCENNQLSALRELIGPVDESRVKFMETQKVDDEIEVGLQLLREIFSVVQTDRRTEQPLSKLRIGLKCGGSDGFSGITANPLVGRFSNFLISQGGSTVLTEVPEMFGAETILMNRCRDRATFDRMVGMINGFKDYFISNGQPIYENPSPGNKAGGISTLEEKSLGCVQKGGDAVVEDILDYGDRISRSGLSLLYAPGNDLVASTALASAGCQLILFTTGRGTPFGTFVPTVKIATNTPLFCRKASWIDFNAGTIVERETMEQALNRLLIYIIGVANGEPTNNERNNHRDLAIFKTGVTL